MQSESSLQSPAADTEASEVRIAYHVTKSSHGGVRVTGRSGNLECLFERHDGQHSNRFAAELLRDQPLYRMSSPLTISASS